MARHLNITQLIVYLSGEVDLGSLLPVAHFSVIFLRLNITTRGSEKIRT